MNGGGTNVMEMKCCKSHGKKTTFTLLFHFIS